MSKKTRPWIHRLMLNPYFEQAIINHRKITGFGSTYSLLNALNEWYYQEGYMSEKGYQFNKKKYKTTLIENFEINEEARSPVSIAEVSQIEKDAALLLTLKNVYAQWSIMKKSSKEYYIKKALSIPDFAISLKILASAREEGLLDEGDPLFSSQVKPLVLQYLNTVVH